MKFNSLNNVLISISLVLTCIISCSYASLDQVSLTKLRVGGVIGLTYKSFGNEEAKEIAEALKLNASLTALNLEANQIGDAGTVALADALIRNRYLTTLNLGVNQIGEVGGGGTC